jgi:hypothetical protein
MSTETTTSDSTGTGIKIPVVDNAAYNLGEIKAIVDLIKAKFEDEGERNFAIGRRTYLHAQWQKGNFPGYLGSDFDSLCRTVREDVRMVVSIKPESIRVDDWVRTDRLRTLVIDAIGEDEAKQLSFYEYRTLTSKALAFDKKSLEFSINDGYMELVRKLSTDRSTGAVRKSSEDFASRIDGYVKAVASDAALSDPAAAATAIAAKAIQERSKAVSKANSDITTGVSDALSKGFITADGVLGIVENVAKHLNIPLPTAIGFDPATCTVADCDLLASTMFAAGKFTEMVHLRDKLNKMVSAVEKARAAAESRTPAATNVVPVSTKVDREIMKDEPSEAATAPKIKVKPTKHVGADTLVAAAA